MLRRWGFITIFVLIGLAAAGRSAEAQSPGQPIEAPQVICTWTSSALGNWNDPTKWTGCAGGVPGAADTAIVSSGTITLTSDVTLGTLTFSGGTIQGTSNLVVTNMTWTGGTFKDAGTTTVNGTLDMSNSSCTLDGRTLINAGSATMGGSSVYLILYNNAVFTNQAGASMQFSHTSSGQITYSTGSGTFNNSGFITKTFASSGFTYIYAPFNNSGSLAVINGTFYMSPVSSATNTNTGTWRTTSASATIQHASGTLSVDGVITGTGTMQFSGGTVNYNTGTYSVTNTTVSGATVLFAPGTSFTSSNNTTLSSGTLNLSTGTPIAFKTLTQSGGTLTGFDDFTVATYNWTGGTLSGASTSATVTGTLNMANSSVTLDSRTVNNAGTGTVSGSSAYLIMYNGATFNNQAGASLQFDHTGTGQFTYSTGSGTFNNAGVITKTASSNGFTYFYVPFNNSGSVTVNGGTLYLGPTTATTSNHSGPFSVANGATLQVAGSGTINFATNVTGLGSGLFSGGTTNFTSGTYNLPNTTVSGGTVTFAAGSSFSSPNLTVSGGTLSLNTGAAHTFTGLTLSGGTLTGTDNFTVATMTWTGGTLSGAGATATVTGTLGMANSSVTLDGRTFNNAGSATLSGTSFYLVMYGGAVFNNQSGAALQVTHTGSGQFTYSTGGGTFNNAGVITKTAGSSGITYIYTPFNNSGSVTVNGGTLYLTPAAATTSNHSGPFSIATGATLQVAGNGTLNFTGGITGGGSGLFSGSTSNFNGGTYTLPSLTVSGGTLNLNTGAAHIFGALTLSGGTLTGADNFSVAAMTWTGGTLSGVGATTTVTGTLDMPSSNVTLDGRTFNNAGTATIGGTSFYMVLYNGAVVNNLAGATLEFLHSGTGQLTYSTGGGAFNNSGVITKPLVSNGYTYIYPTYSQSGSFAVQGGSVSFNPNTGTTGNITGAFTLAPGTLAYFAGSGTLNFAAGSSLTGAGAVTFASGTVNFKAGSTYAISTTQVTGGTADFSATSAVTFDDVTAAGGTFRIGDITVTGDLTRTFGTFTVLSGTVTFAGGTQQNLKLDQATTFNNLTVNAGTTLIETVDANNAGVSGVLTNQGTLRKTKSIPGSSVYTAGLTGATISVTVKGTLSAVTISQVGANHPAGTAQTATGRYWTIAPTGSTYTVALTLPNAINPSSQANVCYFDTASLDWVCDKTSTTANTVTLADITDLEYDWVVGKPGGRLYLPMVVRN